MVKITLSITADTATTILGLLHNLELLKGLQNLAGDRSGGVGVVRGTGTTVLPSTVHHHEGTDTGSRANVQMTGNRG